MTVGLPTCPGSLTVNGIEQILEAGCGNSLVPATLTVGASGSTLPAQGTVYGNFAVVPGPTGSTASLLVEGDIAAVNATLQGGSPSTLTVDGSVIIGQGSPPVLSSAAPACACASCRAALQASAVAPATLQVGSATDAAPADVQLWGNTIVAFPSSYTGGTGSPPLLTVLGDATIAGTLTASSFSTGTGGIVLPLIVGPTTITGGLTVDRLTTTLSANINAASALSTGSSSSVTVAPDAVTVSVPFTSGGATGANSVTLLPTSIGITAPLVAASATDLAILQCVQPGGLNQNTIQAGVNGLYLAATSPGSTAVVSAGAVSVGTPLSEAQLQLNTSGANLNSLAGTVTLDARQVNVTGRTTGGNGIVLTASNQAVNAQVWTLANATNDYYAQMFGGSQWKIQAGGLTGYSPTSLQMQPSGSTWTSPGVGISAEAQYTVDVPRTGVTGGYTSNSQFARNDTAGWNFQTRDSFNVNLNDGSNTSGFGVNAGGWGLSSDATGSSGTLYAAGNSVNKSQLRLIQGGAEATVFGTSGVTGGNRLSVMSLGGDAILQSFSPGSRALISAQGSGSRVFLESYLDLAGTRGSALNLYSSGEAYLQSLATGGFVNISGGPGGYILVGEGGATDTTSSYFRLANSQPRDTTPANGEIQFGSDGALYFFNAGAWAKVSTTAAAPP